MFSVLCCSQSEKNTSKSTPHKNIQQSSRYFIRLNPFNGPIIHLKYKACQPLRLRLWVLGLLHQQLKGKHCKKTFVIRSIFKRKQT